MEPFAFSRLLQRQSRSPTWRENKRGSWWWTLCPLRERPKLECPREESSAADWEPRARGGLGSFLLRVEEQNDFSPFWVTSATSKTQKQNTRNCTLRHRPPPHADPPALARRRHGAGMDQGPAGCRRARRPPVPGESLGLRAGLRKISRGVLWYFVVP